MNFTPGNLPDLFLAETEELLSRKFRDCHNFNYWTTPEEPLEQPLQPILDEMFDAPNKWWRYGKHIGYCNWMIGGTFPQPIYEEHGCDLRKLMADERFYAEPTYAAKENYTSFFGRMARPRPNQRLTFLEYLLERWESERANLSHRHFYFDVESPEWVFAELIRNPRQVKTGRTSTACIMNWSFHVSEGMLIMCILMRSMQWSHMYGELYGGTLALQALLREMRLPTGRLSVFTPRITMDKPKEARELFRRLEGG